MQVDVKVSGLAQLLETLKQFPEKLQKNAVNAGVRAGAAVTRDEARQQLARQWMPSLLSRTTKKKSKKKNKDGTPKKQAIKLRTVQRAITVTKRRGNPTQVFYSIGISYKKAGPWWWLEFGTAQRTRKKGETGIMPARPFMRPAFDGTREQALKAIVSKIQSYMRSKTAVNK